MKHRFESENHAYVFRFFTTKINQISQPDSSATQFIQQLGFVSRLVNNIRLQFDDDFICHQQIGSVITYNDAFELDLYFWFKLHLDTSQMKFCL